MEKHTKDNTDNNIDKQFRAWTNILLFSVGICASSGLIYELALITMSTNINGGGIVATSLIISFYVASLGLGALAANKMLKNPARNFLIIESILGLSGGLSSIFLYFLFAQYGQEIYSTMFVIIITFIIGALVGMEVPLLITLIQNNKISTAEEVGKSVSKLNFSDYAGGLLGGLLWPFILLPVFGIMKGVIIAGIINIAAALCIGLFLFKPILKKSFIPCISLLITSLLIMITAFVLSDNIKAIANNRLYADPVIFSETTKYQDIVVTKYKKDKRLYLNGGLQFSTRDEYRYTESLVYPVLPNERFYNANNEKNVLIIGGGDGLAARELVKYNFNVTQVELDNRMIEIAKTLLKEENDGALENDKVEIITEDGFMWVREQLKNPNHKKYTSIIIDLPDPDNTELARLYSQEFYTMLSKLLDNEGKMVVQSSSPFSTPHIFWRINSTLDSVENCVNVVPYHVHVPTFGDWGYNLCETSKNNIANIPEYVKDMKFLDKDNFEQAKVFGLDNQKLELSPSTLDNPSIITDMRRGYER